MPAGLGAMRGLTSAPRGKPILDARPDLPLSGAARHNAGVPEVLREALGQPAEHPLLVARSKSVVEPSTSLGRRDDTIARSREAQRRYREVSKSYQVVEPVPPLPLCGA